ncbi:putative response regulatory protein [bioreactor metagenome]|jgi:YesN/AraC family two-component response regulator|uniref:Putative response regulatory protein n=1 Tax=bioreactor metagenome TaxID=1076179 RepID=A0A644X208_9ZZZZ|nr:response regulator [Sphaerochaeta sp.]
MYTLVIVDDEKELLEGLSHYFPWESIGFVVAASFLEGRSALSYCKQHKIDVLLTDIRMPFMSGLELIASLKQLPSPPLFCIMSAYNDFEYAKQAISFGVQDYLVKPASFEEITKTFLKIRENLDGTLPKENSKHEVEGRNPLVGKTFALVEKRLGSCSLQNIASELGVTTSYLSRLFKEETGQNFQEYLLKEKMEMAKAMLAGKVGYKNKDIARALGYQDTQNFCRTFRKYWGKSPQQYRVEMKG